MARNEKTRGTRVPPKDCGLTRITSGVHGYQPDVVGNRAQRRLAAKRKGLLGKKDRSAVEPVAVERRSE
jgi:hypothetical protein